jgi:hypothetical protein
MVEPVGGWDPFVGIGRKVDTSGDHGGDREIGTVTEESDGDFPTSRLKTPEEIAREFLQSGKILVDAEPEETPVRRSWAPVFGVIGVIVVLAAIVVIVLLSNRHVSHPPAAAVRKPPVTTVPVPVKKVASTTTTTAPPTLPPANSAVMVNVQNASQSNGLAALTAAALTQDGFTVSAVGTAPNQIASGDPSQILYGPTGLSAAHVLGNSLSGPVSYVASPDLTGSNVTLLIASSQLTVVSGTTTTTGANTTTSAP